MECSTKEAADASLLPTRKREAEKVTPSNSSQGTPSARKKRGRPPKNPNALAESGEEKGFHNDNAINGPKVNSESQATKVLPEAVLGSPLSSHIGEEQPSVNAAWLTYGMNLVETVQVVNTARSSHELHFAHPIQNVNSEQTYSTNTSLVSSPTREHSPIDLPLAISWIPPQPQINSQPRTSQAHTPLLPHPPPHAIPSVMFPGPFLDAADALIEIEDSLEDEPPVPRASALKKYLEMVQARVVQETKGSEMPACYKAGTFWIRPQMESGFFAQRHLETCACIGIAEGSEGVEHHRRDCLEFSADELPHLPDIFVWHPNLLLDKALRCQNSPCDGHYKSNGWNKDPVARRVIDLDRSFYLMSPRYKCARCRETVNAHDRKILDAIPARLRVEFPALLRHRTALSHRVVEMLLAHPQTASGRRAVFAMVMGWHRRRHERMELQYVDAMAHRRDRALTIPQLEQAAMDVESGEEELEYQEDFESNGEVEVMDMEVAKELIRTVELAQRRMTKAGALDGATAHRSEPLMPGTQDYPAEVSSGVISPVEEIGQNVGGKIQRSSLSSSSKSDNTAIPRPSSSTNNTEFISESVEAGEAATMIDDMQHPPALSDHLPPSTVKYPVIAPKPDTPPYSFLNRIVRVQASEPAKQSTTPSGSPAPSLRPLLPRSTPSSTTSSFVDHFPLTKTYTTSNFPGNPAVFHGNPIPDSMAISDPTIPTPQLTYHIPIAPNPVPQQLAPTPSPTESSAHLNLPTYSSEPYSPSKRRGRRSRAKLIHPPPNTYETLFGRDGSTRRLLTTPNATTFVPVVTLRPAAPRTRPALLPAPQRFPQPLVRPAVRPGKGRRGDGKGLLEGLPDEPCGCEEGKGCPGKNVRLACLVLREELVKGL